MALFSPSESPAVTIKEADLTGIAPNVQSSTGAIVGDFNWGPIDLPTLVSNEANMVEVFAAPDANNTVDFHAAASFLTYSASLYVTRAADASAKNSFDSDAASAAPTVKNRDDFDAQFAALDSDGHTFVAKWAGALGNSIKVEMCAYDSDGSTFTGWTHKSEFDAAPTTSTYAANKGASNDEVHVVVVDEDGEISGTRGTVLERFPFVSIASDAKNTDGSTNYMVDVINNTSQYVWAVGFDATFTTANAGTSATNGKDFKVAAPAVKSISMVNGVNSGALGSAEFNAAYDLVQDVDTFQVDFLIAPALPASDVVAEAIAENLLAIAGARKDCIAIISPAKGKVVGNTSANADIITFADSLTASSYAFLDNQHFKMFDKYNDQFIFVPAAPSTAGLMARSDRENAPWFSPAGTSSGVYFNVVGLGYNPNKTERDALYKANVNPVVNLPGQGVTLYGDKTLQRKPSAFDRINVRRLFIVLERSIGRAAQNVLFQLNDEFTRAEFVNIVEPVLRDVKGRRGLTDFRVVCDETNNTGAVVDRNEFVATVFLKPTRSINYVTLNFVATRTGVDFEEVVGRSN